MTTNFKNLSDNVIDKIQKLNARLDRLAIIYRETLLFTNQTYFIEEVNKLR